MTTQWKMTCALAALAGCGAAPDDERATGSAVAAIEVVPASVQCIRLTLRGATRGFDVTGSAPARLDLGALPSGSMSVTGAAYDVACAGVSAMTQPTWVSDPTSVAVSVGLTTEFGLTMRPNTSVAGRVDFVIPVAHIAVGRLSSYAVLRDGSVRAWGRNNEGQLGDGTTTDRRSPVAVVAPVTPGWVPAQIVAGGEHACLRMNSGVAYCWGNAGNGRLGTGSSTRELTPTPILTSLFTDLGAGDRHGCGLTDESPPRVLCWGANPNGQVGDGTMTERRLPTPVALDAAAEPDAVFAGANASCAVLRGGELWCWGVDHVYAAAGGVIRDENVLTPRASVNGNGGPVDIGFDHRCFRRSDGIATCYGYNSYGQLGTGNRFDTSVPVLFQVSNVTQIVAGGRSGLMVSGLSRVGSYTCALRQDGTVWCAGSALGGSTPTQVANLTRVIEIAAGDDHTCALRDDGTVWCWGNNYYGQLGDGTTRFAFVPVRVRL